MKRPTTSKIAKVDEKNRSDVIKRLRSDLLHNLFAIHTLVQDPEKTTLYAAYGDNGSLRAHLLVYRGFATIPLAGRIDGEQEPARRLLEFLLSEKMVLFCPPTLVNVVREGFPDACFYPEQQMYVAKGEERLVAPNLAQRLAPEHASLLAELYSSGERQSARSEEGCKELLGKRRVYGVFTDSKLVSASVAVERLPEAWEIIGVFTDPDYRGRGFATMATSAATHESLKHAGGVSLWVGSENTPAIRVYQKLGYKKVGEAFWVDRGTGLKP